MMLTGGIALFGIVCSVWLYRQAPRGGRPWADNELLRGDRPWRRLGAVMVGFVALMYFAGANFLSAERSPRHYVLFWLGVLLMILWMCILALVDTLHTLRLKSMQLRHGRDDELPPQTGDHS
jgi:hypothetical protein